MINALFGERIWIIGKPYSYWSNFLHDLPVTTCKYKLYLRHPNKGIIEGVHLMTKSFNNLFMVTPPLSVKSRIDEQLDG
ncbi:7739_t:CDS:2 [Gigaspora rosea]|nr:7739_t:CDS:2 [Gigaspora rosea]